ncbi:MAG TPA: hypothetical protein VF795_03335 [Desulfuromonadaceae bacterium]
MLRSDFDFVIDLNKGFFAQRVIQHLLATMERNGTAGWEPWWQVEFARFLHRHRDRHEWSCERRIGTDRAKNKNTVADFTIKRSNSAGDRAILLKLRQDDSIRGCIADMTTDIRTAGTMKTGSSPRSFWVVGVHPRECKNTVRKTVEEMAAEYGIRLFDVQTRYILNTGYAFTIF